MLLFDESRTRSSPSGDMLTEYGSIPALLPSNIVSTLYPLSNLIPVFPETTTKGLKGKPTVSNITYFYN
jgi:hypothetical protein